MEATDALFHPHGVPGQVIVDQLVAELQIAPLGPAFGGDHHPHAAFECGHSGFFLANVQPAVEADDVDAEMRAESAV